MCSKHKYETSLDSSRAMRAVSQPLDIIRTLISAQSESRVCVCDCIMQYANLSGHLTRPCVQSSVQSSITLYSMVRLSSLRYEVLPSEGADSEQVEDDAPNEDELSDPEEPSEDTPFIEELEKGSCTAIVVSVFQCLEVR